MRNASFGACTRPPLVAAGLLAATLLMPAYAADPPAKKATPVKQQGKGKLKPMSRDQLRACMDQQDHLLEMREKVLQERTSLDNQRAEVVRMDQELERKRAALDPADTAAKQALVDEEGRRNEAGDKYNAQLPALRDQVATLDKERQSWVEKCADKDFDERDELAIQRERQRASGAAAGGKPSK